MYQNVQDKLEESHLLIYKWPLNEYLWIRNVLACCKL